MEVGRLKKQSATRTNGRTRMTPGTTDHPRPQTTPPTKVARTQVMSEKVRQFWILLVYCPIGKCSCAGGQYCGSPGGEIQ